MLRFPHLPTGAGLFLLCLVSALLFGCSEQPQIQRALVPKPPKIVAEDRMLAAIVPAGKKGWFFKLQGKSAAVTVELPKFQALLQSLEVDGDKVTWSKPAGWDEEPGSGMRAATFKIGQGDAKLECTVISLPADDPTTDDYLLSNINRWRGQIGLGNLSKSDIARASADEGEVRKLSLKSGVPVTWVNFEGTIAQSGGMPPFAGGMGAGMADAPFAGGGRREQGPSLPERRPGPVAPATDEFTYDTPEGWQPGPTGEFRKVSFFVKGDGGAKVEITVSSLAAAGSALLPNINRWRGQVKLPEVDQATLDKSLVPVAISGKGGHFVELAGGTETILGAVVLVGDEGWFFKLRGDKALAAQEKDNFLSFVKSMKIKE